MMFKEGTCPKCHEKLQVPDGREKIICMFCGEEILVADALGEKPEVDMVAYGENYNRALMGLEDMIRTCYNPMKDFKKDRYEGSFEAYYSAHRSLYEAMEYVYRSEEDKEGWLLKMADRLIQSAKADMKTLKTRNQRSQRMQDLNFLVSIYVIPSVLKYPSAMAEPFADCLLRQWNQEFRVTLGKAHFDDIDNGFHRKLCYVTTAVCENLGKGPDCYELNLLKDYRDHYLDKTPEGHALVEEYYDIAPTIVKRVEKQPDRDRIYRELYDRYLIHCIHDIEAQRMEECKALYYEMVAELKSRYMN